MSSLGNETQETVVQVLHRDIITLLRQAETINVLNPFSAYSNLRSIEEKQKQISKRLDALHDQYRQSLSGEIRGPALAIGPYLTQIAGQGLSVLMQVERSWQMLDSKVDQKNAYTFGFFSLYVAIISLIATVTLGIASLL